MKAILTKLSADGERMIARDGDGNRVSIPKPDQMTEWHRDAAIALVRKMGWAPVVFATGWVRAGEWVHVMLPRCTDRAMLLRLGCGDITEVEQEGA